MKAQEQNTRLTTAYRQLPPEGQEALDEAVQKLAELDETLREKKPAPPDKAPSE
ncbi:MAG: hypothetical protein LBT39_07690 [Treponema sp.]|nr:hypothetical protein [Treponema sp.]